MSEVREQVGGGAWVASGMVTMNVAAYGFTVVATRLLAPDQFAAVTALLGILLVGNVAALGLQASTARRLAVDADRADEVVSTTLRVTLATSVSVGALVAVGTLVLTPVLRLDSYLPVLLCAAALVPMTIVGTQFGIAQGTERWRLLSLTYAVAGFGRLAGGTVGLLVSPTATGAVLGIAVGAWLPVVVGARLLMARDHTGVAGERRSFVREAIFGSHALLAYFVLSNLDALLARDILGPDDAGPYAAGLVLTKAALFMPQFVSVVLFPHLARDATSDSRRRAVLSVVALGVLAVGATATLPRVALILVGGDKYAAIADRLWLFALAGSVLAIVHLLVFDALARHAHGVVVLLWSAVAAVAVAAYTIDVHITGLVVIVTVVATSLATALWFVAGRSTPSGSPTGQ